MIPWGLRNDCVLSNLLPGLGTGDVVVIHIAWDMKIVVVYSKAKSQAAGTRERDMMWLVGT